MTINHTVTIGITFTAYCEGWDYVCTALVNPDWQDVTITSALDVHGSGEHLQALTADEIKQLEEAGWDAYMTQCKHSNDEARHSREEDRVFMRMMRGR